MSGVRLAPYPDLTLPILPQLGGPCGDARHRSDATG
jgi:hypothetical protein